MNKKEMGEIKKILKTKSEELKKTYQSSFREMVSVIFDAFPEANTISFTGYTPAFNDGDECRFRCQSDYPSVNGFNLNEDRWEDDFYRNQNETNAARELANNVGELLSSIPDDIFSSTFGSSGFLATVTRTKIVVEDYDCGY